MIECLKKISSVCKALSWRGTSNEFWNQWDSIQFGLLFCDGIYRTWSIFLRQHWTLKVITRIFALLGDKKHVERMRSWYLGFFKLDLPLFMVLYAFNINRLTISSRSSLTSVDTSWSSNIKVGLLAMLWTIGYVWIWISNQIHHIMMIPYIITYAWYCWCWAYACSFIFMINEK